jgi:hypothetical protein
MIKARVFRLAAGLALALGGLAGPAEAQFMTNYPVIIVPPPQAQNLVVPRSSPTTNQLNRQYPPSPDSSATDTSQCTYQGRVKVCH